MAAIWIRNGAAHYGLPLNRLLTRTARKAPEANNAYRTATGRSGTQTFGTARKAATCKPGRSAEPGSTDRSSTCARESWGRWDEWPRLRSAALSPPPRPREPDPRRYPIFSTCARPSVFQRDALRPIHDDQIHRGFCRLQLQAKLTLHRPENIHSQRVVAQTHIMQLDVVDSR